jgi:hypothetical protein
MHLKAVLPPVIADLIYTDAAATPGAPGGDEDMTSVGERKHAHDDESDELPAKVCFWNHHRQAQALRPCAPGVHGGEGGQNRGCEPLALPTCLPAARPWQTRTRAVAVAVSRTAGVLPTRGGGSQQAPVRSLCPVPALFLLFGKEPQLRGRPPPEAPHRGEATRRRRRHPRVGPRALTRGVAVACTPCHSTQDTSRGVCSPSWFGGSPSPSNGDVVTVSSPGVPAAPPPTPADGNGAFSVVATSSGAAAADTPPAAAPAADGADSTGCSGTTSGSSLLDQLSASVSTLNLSVSAALSDAYSALAERQSATLASIRQLTSIGIGSVPAAGGEAQAAATAGGDGKEAATPAGEAAAAATPAVTAEAAATHEAAAPSHAAGDAVSVVMEPVPGDAAPAASASAEAPAASGSSSNSKGASVVAGEGPSILQPRPRSKPDPKGSDSKPSAAAGEEEGAGPVAGAETEDAQEVGDVAPAKAEEAAQPAAHSEEQHKDKDKVAEPAAEVGKEAPPAATAGDEDAAVEEALAAARAAAAVAAAAKEQAAEQAVAAAAAAKTAEEALKAAEAAAAPPAAPPADAAAQ